MTQIPKKLVKAPPTQIHEERITGTGTWTKPAGVDSVELFLVGGGGAGTTMGGPPFVNPVGNGAGGGGGSVRRAVVPVSGPVPISIGSGGVAATGPSATIVGTNGGDTVWDSGPASITAEGGGAGNNLPGTPVPAVGVSGGHGPSSPTPNSPNIFATGGGGALEPAIVPGFNQTTRNRRANFGGSGAPGLQGDAKYSTGGAGIEGFGGGGGGAGSSSGGGVSPNRNVSGNGSPGASNTGGGGGGAHKIITDPAPLVRAGGNGASGIAIVRYRE